MSICLHCQKCWASRARGLCGLCYFIPGVRERYPLADSKYSQWAHTSWRSATLAPGLAPEPTRALPGSEEKVAVLAARFAAGVGLHSPQDARLDPEEP